MITVYHYIANVNPRFAKTICNQYGYKTLDVRSKNDLADCLAELVSREGEPALRQIMERHPDKEVILEMFSQKGGMVGADGTTDSGCGCGSKCKCSGCKSYSNADGQTAAIGTASQTNTIIIAAALILAVAIISKR